MEQNSKKCNEGKCRFENVKFKIKEKNDIN
jgi:hypothetical protein